MARALPARRTSLVAALVGRFRGSVFLRAARARRGPLCRGRDSGHTRARRIWSAIRSATVKMNLKVLEWFGVITAIAYSLFVASNVGLEFVGFVLLFISAISIGAWAYLGGHRGILLLQFFYAVAGLIGMVRWF